MNPDENNHIFEDEISDEIPVMNSELEKALNNLKSLPDLIKREKLKDIQDMIRYYGDSTRNIEDKRNRIAEISWQSILIILGVVTICFSLEIPIIYKASIGVFIIYIFFQQISKIQEYFEQSDFKYPFLSIPDFSNKWKWFYYANRYITELSTNPHKKDYANDQLLYLKGLNLFINSYTKEEINAEIEDGIQQLYLLQVHNFYKNKFYLRLLALEKQNIRSLSLYFLKIFSLVIILAYITYYLFPNFFNYIFLLPEQVQ